MRVVFFVHRYYPSIGGTQVLTYELAKRLVKLGNEVTVFTTMDNKMKTLEIAEGIKILRYPRVKVPYISHPWCLAPTMIKVLWASELRYYDVLHSFGYITFQTLLAYLAKMKFRKPLVITAQYHPWEGLYPKVVGKRILESADVIIAQCSWEKEGLGSFISHKRIVTIPVGINKEEFLRLPSKNKAREELGIPKKTTVILYVGAVNGHKRVVEFINLILNYLLKYNITFLIVGKNARKLKTYTVIRRLEKIGKILVKSNVSRDYILRAYASADLFVNPSKHESFGISVLEAAASGLPIVSTNTGVASDIVINNFNGYLCHPGYLRELVLRVIDVIRNLSKLSKGAKIIRSKILEKYDWSKVIRSYVSVYKYLYL